MGSQPAEKGRLMSRAEQLEQMRRKNLFNNTFMSVALRDKQACQHVLRILLEIPDLMVQEVRTQYAIPRLISKDSVLDVLAEDSRKKLYSIEIQRTDTVDHARRVRYYGAMLDSEFLGKGKPYQDMPDVYLIYISELDIWKHGLAIYQVQKSLQDVRPYDDGMRVLYVNAAVDDGTARARLMRYFRTADPKDQSQGALSERVQYLKTEEGGIREMDELLEEVYLEGKEDGREEGRMEEAKRLVFRMFVRGDTVEEIQVFADMPLSQIEAWRREWEAEQKE